jgi:hypothetical protein
MRLPVAAFGAAAAATLLLAGCHPPQIVQGTVVRIDEATQVLVLRDELPPNDEHEYAIADAALNVPPAVGDVVRIAYHQVGDRRIASRVMNVGRSATTRHTAGVH